MADKSMGNCQPDLMADYFGVRGVSDRLRSWPLILFAGFILSLTGCGQRAEVPTQPISQKVAGMCDFDYLACDGGPHLVLPKELSRQWQGVGPLLGALSSSGDYGRACAATTNGQMTLISVGQGQAMVLDNPPMSAWGHSPEGWVDIYFLAAWADTNTDLLLKRAVQATPTSAMVDTGKKWALTQPGMVLLFAGDKPGDTAFGENPIPIEPGSFRILEGHYKGGSNEEIYIYRLQPDSHPTAP